MEKIGTEENTSDICTKNTDVKTFKYHGKEIDEGFPNLKKKVFGPGGTIDGLSQKLFGGLVRAIFSSVTIQILVRRPFLEMLRSSNTTKTYWSIGAPGTT